MLDRFTDRARKVMSMAKQEALDLHSNKVGTEHLLLALAKEDEGIAAEALRSLDISYDDIMDTLKEVQTTVPEPSEETEAAKLAFTPLVISVMERSFRVARENNQTYVSTEHLLIGIVEEGNGMAMEFKRKLPIPKEIREEMPLPAWVCRLLPLKRPSKSSLPRIRTRSVRSLALALVVPVRACRSLAARMPLSKRGAAPTRSSSSPPTSRKRRATASSIP